MEKEDIARIVVYTVATVVYIIVYNVVLSANAFLRATDFRLYGSLCIVFTWIMLMMLDLTLTIGSFSNAWITIVSIGLGICVFAFGIYMIVGVSGWGLQSSYGMSSNSPQSLLLENSWLFGMAIAPMIGGPLANILIIYKLRDEQLSWWLGLAYAAAYISGVILCAIFGRSVHQAMIFVYVVFGIGNLVVGFLTVKEVFF